MGLLDEFGVYVDGLKRRMGNTLGELGSDPVGLMSRNSYALSETLPPRPGQDSVMPGANGGGLLGRPSLMDWGQNMAMNSPGGLLGVVKPATAMKSGVPVNMPTAPEFASAVANTPGAAAGSEGLLMRVMRNQLPEQGQRESVRGGVFYLPEGAEQAKHYKTGTSKPGGNSYGGPEQISGETLVRNPLFVKGSTGGKAPEAAYDSLAGKGAYQKMRRDALHWSGGPKEIREEAVNKFLDTYAPEMAGKADYILQNSKHGNQLPYALQEAAVASAVRRAGHDAVLGYGKKRTGEPFISELFDVRESHYPDKFGFSRTWPEFEGK